MSVLVSVCARVRMGVGCARMSMCVHESACACMCVHECVCLCISGCVLVSVCLCISECVCMSVGCARMSVCA